MNLNLNDILLIILVLILGVVVVIYTQFKKFSSLLEFYVGQRLKRQQSPRETEAAKRMAILRLQAHERIILFVERIKPDSMIPRTMAGGLNCHEYHVLLLGQIRNEYEYNLSQQLYMSSEAWNMVNDYKNNVSTLINTAATECQPTDEAGKLARRIIEKYIESKIEVEPVLQTLRAEIQKEE